MRRALLVGLACVIAIGMLAGTGSASRRSKARVDHVRYYSTCATCPRAPEMVTYDGGYVVCRTKKAVGVAYNRVGWRLFTFWQRGTACYNPPHNMKSIDWAAGASAANWAVGLNPWKEDRASRATYRGRGKKDGVERRYSRTEFYLDACAQGWCLHAHDWVSQAFWSDGNYGFGHS